MAFQANAIQLDAFQMTELNPETEASADRAIFNRPWFNQTWFNATPIENPGGTEGLLTSAGELAKTISKILSGSISPAGVLARQAWKYVSAVGSLTSSGVLIKQTSKALVGTFTPFGVLIKQSVVLIYYRTMDGAITLTGAITKQVDKVFAGALTSSGLLSKTVGKLLTASQALAGALSRLFIPLTSNYYYVYIIGFLDPEGAVTKVTQFAKTLTGAISPAGVLIRDISKFFTGAISSAGQLTGPIGQILRLPFNFILVTRRTVATMVKRRTRTDIVTKRTKVDL